MPMQPSPMAETETLVLPSLRYFIRHLGCSGSLNRFQTESCGPEKQNPPRRHANTRKLVALVLPIFRSFNLPIASVSRSRQFPHDIPHERLRISKQHQCVVEVVERVVDAR